MVQRVFVTTQFLSRDDKSRGQGKTRGMYIYIYKLAVRNSLIEIAVDPSRSIFRSM